MNSERQSCKNFQRFAKVINTASLIWKSLASAQQIKDILFRFRTYNPRNAMECAFVKKVSHKRYSLPYGTPKAAASLFSTLMLR